MNIAQGQFTFSGGFFYRSLVAGSTNTAPLDDTAAWERIAPVVIVDKEMIGLGKVPNLDTSRAVRNSLSKREASTVKKIPSADATSEPIAYYKVRFLTQAAYDALATKDTYTLYFITV